MQEFNNRMRRSKEQREELPAALAALFDPLQMPRVGKALARLIGAKPDPDPRVLRISSHNSGSFLGHYFHRIEADIAENPNPLRAVRTQLYVDLFQGLRGRVVLDLGAGVSPLGYALSAAVGAKGYIGVEAFSGTRLREEIVRTMKSQPDKRELIPACVIEKDMRQVLKALPPSSVSLLVCGIDSTLFAGELDWGESLLREIGKGAVRVLGKGDVLISVSSELELGDKLAIELPRIQGGKVQVPYNFFIAQKRDAARK